MIFEVCEPLYSANRLSPFRINVNQGGTSSAKTYTICQILCEIAATQDNQVITIVGQDIPNLKKGAIRDMQKIIARSKYLQSKLYDYKRTKGYNKTDRIYEWTTGSIIEFTSYESEQDAKSGKRDYLFVNEANGVAYEIFWQLEKRTMKQTFIDYNPTARFWAHEYLIGRPGVKLIISDHRHNRFLPQHMHDEIEGIEDPQLWRVYARGLTGQIKGLIYNNWGTIDIMPGTIPSVLGLDFGFNHKTALIDVGFHTNKLFWDQLIYASEMTIGDLIQEMKELNIGKKMIYADPAAADKIEDLRRVGFNVHKADKDIKNGIDFVKRNNLYITKRSHGLRQELLGYKWKTNKDGITLDEPVKFKDDALDGGRYGSYTGFRKNKGIWVANTTQTESVRDDYDLGLLDDI